MDGLPAEPSQYAPQYLLPGAAGQLQPGWAHFSIFFSAIETPLAPFAVAEKHTPRHTQNQSRDRVCLDIIRVSKGRSANAILPRSANGNRIFDLGVRRRHVEGLHLSRYGRNRRRQYMG